MTGGIPRWAIILHGGANYIAPEDQGSCRSGCLAGLTIGQDILQAEGTAADAVEAVVRALENNPVFNAGYGSVLNSDGEVEMDAAFMDGRTLDIGAVGAIKGVRNPISVARLMLRERQVFIVGEGAKRFALEKGAELCDPQDMISPRKLARWSKAADTVGCVALDIYGDIVVGTSTGGLTGKPPGRIGDVPIPGCGFYADNKIGGVAFSGEGESIMRTMLAARVMHSLQDQDPQSAIDKAISYFQEGGGEVGGIVLDRLGRIGWAHNTPHFAIAFVTSETKNAYVHLHRSEGLQSYVAAG